MRVRSNALFPVFVMPMEAILEELGASELEFLLEESLLSVIALKMTQSAILN